MPERLLPDAERRSWLVLRENDEIASRCMTEAITASAHRLHRGTVDYLHAKAAVLSVIGGDSMNAWNDAPERTHAEVIAALSAAIAAEEATP